jgi:hypothetical protein
MNADLQQQHRRGLPGGNVDMEKISLIRELEARLRERWV